jgi:hypothetical protein
MGSILEMNSRRLLRKLFITESGLGDVLGEIKKIILPSSNLKNRFGTIVFFKRNDGAGPFSMVAKC